MRLLNLGYVVAVFAIMLSAVISSPAKAQVKFEFDGGDQVAIAYLQSRGYTDVRIIANELIQVRVEACKDGIRYRFKVRIDGRIFNQRKIGTCGALTAKQIRKLLRDAGYRQIEISKADGRYIAFGCKNDDKFRVILRLDGATVHTKRIGSCVEELSRGEVAALLRRQGFDGIDFQRSGTRDFVVHACLGRAKFELVVNPQGNIASERRIGLCEDQISPRDIPRILEAKGFTRIEVVDDELPGYVATACKDGHRIEVTLNRFGRITKTKRRGRCAKLLTQDEIVAILIKRGFRRIDVVKADNRNYVIDACYKKRKLRMTFTVYGDFVSERDRGGCQSRRLSEILDELDGRGIKDLEVYVEGCRRNRRIRIPLDELGDAGKRERIGAC